MKPGKFDFPPMLRGDTFIAWDFALENCNKPIDLTGAEVDISVARRKAEPPAFKIDVEIKNPTNGVLTTVPFIPHYSPGVYVYDLTVRFPDGRVQTFLEGEIKIIQNIKRYGR